MLLFTSVSFQRIDAKDVEQLFKDRRWNEYLLRQVLADNVVEHKNIEKIQDTEQRVTPHWMLNNSCKFSVKSA